MSKDRTFCTESTRSVVSSTSDLGNIPKDLQTPVIPWSSIHVPCVCTLRTHVTRGMEDAHARAARCAREPRTVRMHAYAYDLRIRGRVTVSPSDPRLTAQSVHIIAGLMDTLPTYRRLGYTMCTHEHTSAHMSSAQRTDQPDPPHGRADRTCSSIVIHVGT
jgi:hypothetical protein